ncbi:MAG: VOC family protein [Alkalispirochaeta sp.]
MIPVRGLEHIGIRTRDTRTLSRWYGEVFGAKIVSTDDGDPAIYFLSFGGGGLVELIPDIAATATDDVHLCLSVDDIDGQVNALRSMGVDVVRQPFTAYEGSVTAFFRDPAGNLVQLVERVVASAIDAVVYGSPE